MHRSVNERGEVTADRPSLIQRGLGWLCALWPLGLLGALHTGFFHEAVWVLAVLLIARGLLGLKAPWRDAWRERLLGVLGLVVALEDVVFASSVTVLYYPVIVNSVLLFYFGGSLWARETLVERFARLMHKGPEPFPEDAVRYTRRVTQVWCAFFLFNGAVALFTVLNGDMTLWALYNGLVSYLLMGGLAGSEYLYRKWVLHV